MYRAGKTSRKRIGQKKEKKGKERRTKKGGLAACLGGRWKEEKLLHPWKLPALLRYNGHITLCKFKMCNMLI